MPFDRAKAPTFTRSYRDYDSMPKATSLVCHFAAEDVRGVADGLTFSRWVDRINGIVATEVDGTKYPTFTANRLNNKPAIKFNNSRLMIHNPRALRNVIDGLKYTAMIIWRTLGAKSTGTLFGASAGGFNFHFVADGTGVNFQDNNWLTTTYAGQTSFSTMGVTICPAAEVFGANNKQSHYFINGGAVGGSQAASAGSTNKNTLCIGNNAGNNFPCNAEIFDILVWNDYLNPYDVMVFQKWACDRYAQAYPWASVPAFTVFHGDSLTIGNGATTQAGRYPQKVATDLSMAFGTWSNLGIGGITVANMGVNAPSWIDKIAALTGKYVNLVAFEYANQQGASPTPFNASKAYLAARKAAEPKYRIVWGTSTDSSTTPDANRVAYNSDFDGAHATDIDAYVPIHDSLDIGAEGAIVAFPANFSGDGVHLVNAGYAFLATLMEAGIAALPVVYEIIGPTSGANNVASTPFTVRISKVAVGTDDITLTASQGTITATAAGATINNNGTGTVQVEMPAGMFEFTFTYTPTTSGAKTITPTNGQSWTDPSALNYTSV